MNLNVNTTLTTLRTGIWFSSRFKEQLKVQPPILLENVIHHALAYYLLEDKTTIFSAKHSRDPSPLPLAKKITKPNGSLSSEHNYAIDRSPNTKNVNFNLEKFCKFHKKKGHSTEECRTMDFTYF